MGNGHNIQIIFKQCMIIVYTVGLVHEQKKFTEKYSVLAIEYKF